MAGLKVTSKRTSSTGHRALAARHLIGTRIDPKVDRVGGGKHRIQHEGALGESPVPVSRLANSSSAGLFARVGTVGVGAVFESVGKTR